MAYRNATDLRQARLCSLFDEHGHAVRHVLSKAGVPDSELEDDVQRTFIVAADRLADVQPGSERSFLLQVARNVALHTRRTLARRREVLGDRLPERSEPFGTPEDLTLRKQTRRLLDLALAGLPPSLRSVFMLSELQELGTFEIARMLGIPRGTVASRLRRARAEFRQSLRAIELALELDIARRTPFDEPLSLRREAVSPFARALLGAGALMPGSPTMRARTLAACLALAAGRLRRQALIPLYSQSRNENNLGIHNSTMLTGSTSRTRRSRQPIP